MTLSAVYESLSKVFQVDQSYQVYLSLSTLLLIYQGLLNFTKIHILTGI